MRILMVLLGLITLVAGIIGIFLPVLPTTPFLLLSAALFVRSSPRLYHWLMNHPHLGPYITNFRENKAIPLRVKIVSVSLLWITLLYCTFFVAESLVMQIIFPLIAIGVTIHILSFKTLR